jgi:hypothetical protein
VENCKIPKFQVKYDAGWPSAHWSNSITPEEGANVPCVSGAKYTINLTDDKL